MDSTSDRPSTSLGPHRLRSSGGSRRRSGDTSTVSRADEPNVLDISIECNFNSDSTDPSSNSQVDQHSKTSPSPPLPGMGSSDIVLLTSNLSMNDDDHSTSSYGEMDSIDELENTDDAALAAAAADVDIGGGRRRSRRHIPKTRNNDDELNSSDPESSEDSADSEDLSGSSADHGVDPYENEPLPDNKLLVKANRAVCWSCDDLLSGKVYILLTTIFYQYFLHKYGFYDGGLAELTRRREMISQGKSPLEMLEHRSDDKHDKVTAQSCAEVAATLSDDRLTTDDDYLGDELFRKVCCQRCAQRVFKNGTICKTCNMIPYARDLDRSRGNDQRICRSCRGPLIQFVQHIRDSREEWHLQHPGMQFHQVDKPENAPGYTLLIGRQRKRRIRDHAGLQQSLKKTRQLADRHRLLSGIPTLTEMGKPELSPTVSDATTTAPPPTTPATAATSAPEASQTASIENPHPDVGRPTRQGPKVEPVDSVPEIPAPPRIIHTRENEHTTPQDPQPQQQHSPPPPLPPVLSFDEFQQIPSYIPANEGKMPLVKTVAAVHLIADLQNAEQYAQALEQQETLAQAQQQQQQPQGQGLSHSHSSSGGDSQQHQKQQQPPPPAPPVPTSIMDIKIESDINKAIITGEDEQDKIPRKRGRPPGRKNRQKPDHDLLLFAEPPRVMTRSRRQSGGELLSFPDGDDGDAESSDEGTSSREAGEGGSGISSKALRMILGSQQQKMEQLYHYITLVSNNKVQEQWDLRQELKELELKLEHQQEQLNNQREYITYLQQLVRIYSSSANTNLQQQVSELVKQAITTQISSIKQDDTIHSSLVTSSPSSPQAQPMTTTNPSMANTLQILHEMATEMSLIREFSNEQSMLNGIFIQSLTKVERNQSNLSKMFLNFISQLQRFNALAFHDDMIIPTPLDDAFTIGGTEPDSVGGESRGELITTRSRTRRQYHEMGPSRSMLRSSLLASGASVSQFEFHDSSSSENEDD